MTAPGIGLIIGVLICIGATLGLYSLGLPGKASNSGEDRGSLVLAFLLGLALLWLVLSGRYANSMQASVIPGKRTVAYSYRY